jgi:hypothetical protein
MARWVDAKLAEPFIPMTARTLVCGALIHVDRSLIRMVKPAQLLRIARLNPHVIAPVNAHAAAALARANSARMLTLDADPLNDSPSPRDLQ